MPTESKKAWDLKILYAGCVADHEDWEVYILTVPGSELGTQLKLCPVGRMAFKLLLGTELPNEDVLEMWYAVERNARLGIVDAANKHGWTCGKVGWNARKADGGE